MYLCCGMHRVLRENGRNGFMISRNEGWYFWSWNVIDWKVTMKMSWFRTWILQQCGIYHYSHRIVPWGLQENVCTFVFVIMRKYWLDCIWLWGWSKKSGGLSLTDSGNLSQLQVCTSLCRFDWRTYIRGEHSLKTFNSALTSQAFLTVVCQFFWWENVASWL